MIHSPRGRGARRSESTSGLERSSRNGVKAGRKATGPQSNGAHTSLAGYTLEQDRHPEFGETSVRAAVPLSAAAATTAMLSCVAIKAGRGRRHA